MKTKIAVTDRNDPEKEAGTATNSCRVAMAPAEVDQNTTARNLQNAACYELGKPSNTLFVESLRKKFKAPSRLEASPSLNERKNNENQQQ